MRASGAIVGHEVRERLARGCVVAAASAEKACRRLALRLSRGSPLAVDASRLSRVSSRQRPRPDAQDSATSRMSLRMAAALERATQVCGALGSCDTAAGGFAENPRCLPLSSRSAPCADSTAVINGIHRSINQRAGVRC
jgi:hypothetical protein